jgi:toxin ParE1/3/4
MMTIYFESEAEIEFQAASEQSLNPDLLESETQLALELISAQPEIGTSLGQRGKIREYVLRRIPYNVVYLVREKSISIIAFAHKKRRRNYWKDRI